MSAAETTPVLIDRRVRALLRAPVAIGMILVAQATGDDATRLLSEPTTATALASSVYADLNPWSDTQKLHEWVLDRAFGLRVSMIDLMSDPGTIWWNSPLDREHQLMVTEVPVVDLEWGVGLGSNKPWETYAQKPVGGQVSSTELSDSLDEAFRSGLHAELATSGSDWHPVYPLRVTRVRVAQKARVYEITGPEDWNQLARDYGDQVAYGGPDPNLLTLSGIDHGIAPAWDAVAADWDGVHASFFGWLTSAFVRTATGSLTTTLWSWPSERTIWVRNGLVDQAEHADEMSTPATLVFPHLAAIADV